MKSTRGLIIFDARPILDAFRRVGRAIARLAHLVSSAGRLEALRTQYGGMRSDAVRWPDEWQSTICAGLLCSITPCPSDTYDLQCHHSCHERESR